MNEKVKNKKQSGLLDPEFLQKLEQLNILSKKVLQGSIKGERVSKKKGISIEYADFRNYVSGDDIRFIDWNIYSRLDKLFLKLFHEEEELFFYVLIDSSQSMDFGNPRKFDYAKKLAAALGYIGLSNMDRVGISAFGEDIQNFFAPKRGRGFVWRMFDFIEALECGGKTSIVNSAKKFVFQNKRKGVVILISDLLDPHGFEEAFRWLGQGGFETYVIHLLSPEEINPESMGHLEIVDSETNEKIEVTINESSLKTYKKTLQLFCEEAKQSCVKKGFMYIPASTEAPVEQFLLNYLRQKGLIK